jgi:hypothetical protein
MFARQNKVFQKPGKRLMIPFLLAFFLLGVQILAQVTIKKDLPGSLELNIEDCLLATITSPEPMTVYMVGTVTEAGKGLVAKVTTNKFKIKSGINRYDAAHIPPIAETWIIPEYESLIERTGKFPEGRYTILIRLFTVNNELLGEDKRSQRVEYPELRLIAPKDGAKIVEPNPLFLWSITRPGSGVKYVLKIFEITPERTKISAVSGVPFFQRKITATSFRYPLSATPFEKGKKYAWQIQALDAAGYPLGKNEGKSEIFLFDYRESTKKSYSIKLVSPEEDAEIPSGQIKFCWEPVSVKDVNYAVYYTHKDCSSLTEEAPHPFAPLLPDSATRRRIRDLRTRKRNLEAKLEHWQRYCEEEVAGMLESSLKNQQAWEEAKEQLRTMAESLKDELDFSLPENCPVRDRCCNNRPCCEGLDPCKEADLETFKERVRCLHEQINSFNNIFNGSTAEFLRLYTRWRSGADHRATMDFYHAYFSLIDDIIGLITSALDLITPDVEDVLEQIIEEAVASGACTLAPEWCEAIQNARTVKEKMSVVQSLMASARSSGSMPPAFIVAMIQAMAQQAASATGVAVAGWDNFADVMVNQLRSAYEALICLLELNQVRMATFRDCDEFCRRLIECLREEIAEIDEEIEEIEEENARERTEYWEEERERIRGEMEQALSELGEGWYERCCREGTGEIRIPGDGECAREAEEALRRVLGDKACFMTFVIRCHPDGRVTIEHSFPSRERREDCCEPGVERTERIGGREGNPPDGGNVCYPEGEREQEEMGRRTLPAGGWRVEAHDREGNLIGESPLRGLNPRRIRSEPYHQPTPIDSVECECNVTAVINGNPVKNNTTVRNLQRGIGQTISVKGDCGKDCAPGPQSITIQPPLVVSAAFGAPIVFLPPPITVNAVKTLYDFPYPGLYKVTVTQFCEDGSSCDASFNVSISEKRKPKPLDPDDIAGLPPAGGCGDAYCLKVLYAISGKKDFKTIAFNSLKLEKPSELELHLKSNCFRKCKGKKEVTWEIKEPDGKKVIKKAVDLYEIKYDFDKVGLYHICVIETANCGGSTKTCSKFLLIETK